MLQSIDDLDATATLARASSLIRARRAAEVEDLRVILHWADLHGGDPTELPGAVPAWAGGNHLVEVGGDGTPLVQDLCFAELGIARQCHWLAARSAAADALDLRHRLPDTWTQVQELVCDVWLARKVAAMSRRLDRHQVALVDAAVAQAIAGETPGRILKLVEAKVIEADTAAHAARLETELRRRCVNFSPSDDYGLRNVFARLEAGDACWLDATVDRVADLLRERPHLRPGTPDEIKHDELRALALGWLARPEDVVDLLEGRLDGEEGEEGKEIDETEAPARKHPQHRQRAVVYLHLHQSAVDGSATGVARVEPAAGVGPLLLEQLQRLLGHAQVSVSPVIDLNTSAAVSSYEHPEAVKERARLRTGGDVFPHSGGSGCRLDTDHPKPWDPHGPPGQTGDHNAAPLTRTPHRAKTHLGYRLRQVSLDSFVWRTPHGLERLVDGTGTSELDPAQALELTSPGELDRALSRLSSSTASGMLPGVPRVAS